MQNIRASTRINVTMQVLAFMSVENHNTESMNISMIINGTASAGLSADYSQ